MSEEQYQFESEQSDVAPVISAAPMMGVSGIGEVAQQIEEIPAAEGADVLESLPSAEAADVAEYLDPNTAGRIFAEMDPTAAASVLTDMEAAGGVDDRLGDESRRSGRCA